MKAMQEEATKSEEKHKNKHTAVWNSLWRRTAHKLFAPKSTLQVIFYQFRQHLPTIFRKLSIVTKSCSTVRVEKRRLRKRARHESAATRQKIPKKAKKKINRILNSNVFDEFKFETNTTRLLLLPETHKQDLR